MLLLVAVTIALCTAEIKPYKNKSAQRDDKITDPLRNIGMFCRRQQVSLNIENLIDIMTLPTLEEILIHSVNDNDVCLLKEGLIDSMTLQTLEEVWNHSFNENNVCLLIEVLVLEISAPFSWVLKIIFLLFKG